MLWLPFRRAWRNPIFQGGLNEFARNTVRWTHGMNYLILLSIVLFITWPKEEFLSLRDLPFAYNALGGAVLIILAYINCSQGARKLVGAGYVSLREWVALVPVAPQVFLRGYMVIGLVESLFFWALSLPLLTAAASVSGESLAHLGAGVLLILVCTGSYRMVAMALLLWLERDEFVLYLLVRVVYICCILVSGFLFPLGNPVLAFVQVSIWHNPQRLQDIVCFGTSVPTWIVTVGLHLLLGGLFYIIASTRVHRLRHRLTPSGAPQEDSGRGNPPAV
jgi:hypothetical protein